MACTHLKHRLCVKVTTDKQAVCSEPAHHEVLLALPCKAQQLDWDLEDVLGASRDDTLQKQQPIIHKTCYQVHDGPWKMSDLLVLQYRFQDLLVTLSMQVALVGGQPP